MHVVIDERVMAELSQDLVVHEAESYVSFTSPKSDLTYGGGHLYECADVCFPLSGGLT